MESDLFYPEINVEIGKYHFDQGIEIECYSSGDSYFDWAKVRFTYPFTEKVAFNKKEKSSLKLGYDGLLEEVFSGYVVNPMNEGDYQNEIILKDDMIFLEDTTITNTFLETTPQEILQYCLSKAGISSFVLSNRVFPKKNVVPIFKKNVISTIEEVHSIWNIRENFFFSNGFFYWGQKPTQPKIYEFEYGVNIISLKRYGHSWLLETVSTPFIKHSHKIQVNHPSVIGEFEVTKVVFKTNDSGFIRTNIYF